MKGIRADGLRKAFGPVQALDGLSFEVPPNSIFGFLGPNGAGKTTTLRILAGLARPDEGQAWLDGQPIGPGSPARRLMGYLPEEPRFYPWMTATEFLQGLVAGVFGLPAHTARRRTAELLDLVGLGQAARRRIGGYSRGMRQRLGLAQALMNSPSVILLDEPVSALDPGGRRDMLHLIDGLRSEAAVLMSTHILDDVERVCDRIGIIDHGRMVVVDDRQALLSRYASPVVRIAFREAAGKVTAWLESLRTLPGVLGVDSGANQVTVSLRSPDEGADQQVLQLAVASGMAIESFQRTTPTLEDVFLRLVGQAGEARQ